jgi:predicted phosphodiesterase
MTFRILTPALACPSLIKKDGYMEVLLLSETKGIHDDLSCITYSRWKEKKEKSFDKKDIDIIPVAPSEYHISSFVMSTYKKEGFTHLVRARITVSESKGLYQVNNPCEHASSIVSDVTPSSFPADIVLHHPFYVGEKDFLTIAHLSDSHTAARMQVLEKRWNTNFNNVWHTSTLSEEKPGDFSNYNTQFEHIVKEINADTSVDILIHTGDIVDYNRGYHCEKDDDLSENYCHDRNWLLFYKILCRNYVKPFFSILGNHDYRLHPYPPNPVVISRRIREFFNMAPTVNLTRGEMNSIHEDPYALNITKNHIITGPQAVHWYSLVINPLLDYEVFYGGMAFLMLDWNRWEDHEGGNPWAARVISHNQWRMLRRWHKKVMTRRNQRKVISLVAMHPSVFNPFPEMGDKELEANPGANVFYTRKLVDRYSPEKDLVDGTFRRKRNEFIQLCLGNMNYGKNYDIFPEKGIDLVLTGHAHRSGLFQVEGPYVCLRRPDSLKKGPVFCNAVSSGPIGIRNEEGGLERIQLEPPGYHVISMDRSISIDMRNSRLVPIREDARRSFGEVARGGFFEVMHMVGDLLVITPSHTWKVTNLKEGSTITRIKIVTGLKTQVEVTETPLGWDSTVGDSNGFTCITCEAHDRGQGIFYGDSGEITIKTDQRKEKIGTLTVCWDMGDDLSLPVCVRVPAG